MNVGQINSTLRENGLASIVDRASPQVENIVFIHVVNQSERATENFRKFYPDKQEYNNVFNIPTTGGI